MLKNIKNNGYPHPISIVKAVKEACRSLLDVVVIFKLMDVIRY